ncbi:hypothetical protein Hanom_Chr02g00096351 [Helianthus anomalus]
MALATLVTSELAVPTGTHILISKPFCSSTLLKINWASVVLPLPPIPQIKTIGGPPSLAIFLKR